MFPALVLGLSAIAAVPKEPFSESLAKRESAYYKTEAFPLPPGCVLEVGGLAVRPDGTLVACTRRGEVWLVRDSNAADISAAKWSRFASGLHEPLGLIAPDDRTAILTQRTEITKLVDTTGDGVADEYATVADGWGASGNYHEFSFGPAVGPDGTYYITLNVAFGGGAQGRAAWRGWCLKVDPKTGKFEPWACGLRSPNSVGVAPDGEPFYCDNQGEWVATNKMHHLKRGGFFGHAAGLAWAKQSPFADALPSEPKPGRWYDGTDPDDPKAAKVYPALDPPCIWFPYAKMGQSVSQPVWDTTGGKFGPFAGQCFVGDITRATVMRVALEKVNGVYQGAAMPFRGGFQCGVNRLAFGPDGTMYVGETNRGWGSVGGKPYGLERVTFAGGVPFEVHHVSVTPSGFDVAFTKPVAAAGADAVAVSSYTYPYWSKYGAPETDTRAEPVAAVARSADGLTLSVRGLKLQKGRVYEILPKGVRSADGEAVLHPEVYYTLNEVPK